MLFLRVILTVILMLLASTSAGQILESLSSALNVKDNTTLENCKNVRDFEPCLKNTCPGYMPCYCREEKEYCRCTNFKGPLGDYWNLGPKCEQQWNTLDLILIAVVPGICLALIIAVCTYCIYNCKKWKHQANAQKRQELTASKTKPKHSMIISNHQNKAFLNDEDDYQFLSGQQQTMVYPPRIPRGNTAHTGRNTQIMPIPKANFSYHQPEPNFVEENFSPSMRHASSSYDEGQHSIPQFRPVNGYPEQDTWVAPAISIKRPEINGIRVLPPIGSGQSFGMGQLHKDPGYQQFHNPVGYGRAQY